MKPFPLRLYVTHEHTTPSRESEALFIAHESIDDIDNSDKTVAVYERRVIGELRTERTLDIPVSGSRKPGSRKRRR
jgi:hypothetical protein